MARNYFVIIIMIGFLASSSAYSAEVSSTKRAPEYYFSAAPRKKIKLSTYTMSSSPFYQWLEKHQNILRKHDNTFIDCEREYKNKKLTLAGILYIMNTFTQLVQHEIIKHLVSDINPLILGIHKEDLTLESRKTHVYPPVLFLRDNTLTIKCMGKACWCTKTPSSVANVPDFFYKSSYDKEEYNIGPICHVINTLSSQGNDNTQLKANIAVSPSSRTIAVTDTNNEERIYTVNAITKNFTFFNDYSKNILSLYDALLLLDQEKRLQGTHLFVSKEVKNDQEKLKNRIKITGADALFYRKNFKHYRRTRRP